MVTRGKGAKDSVSSGSPKKKGNSAGSGIKNLHDFIRELNDLFVAIKEGKVSLKKAREMNRTAHHIVKASALGLLVQLEVMKVDGRKKEQGFLSMPPSK